MVNFYVYRIKTGKITIDDVPSRWKEAVLSALKEQE